MSDEEEFKKELGIHKFDHWSMYKPECIEFLKREYPGISLNLDKNVTYPSLKRYIFHGIEITLIYRNIVLKETVDQVDDVVLIKMLKLLDEMCS